MENKKEYLNENSYQEANKKIKLIGVIVLLIGIALVGFGVYTLIVANSMSIPKMGDPNWFDMSKNQSSKQFTGIASCMIGLFITAVGCMIRFVIPNRRNIMAYHVQQIMPVAQEGIEKMAPTAGSAAKEIAKGITKGIKEGINDDENN